MKNAIPETKNFWEFVGNCEEKQIFAARALHAGQKMQRKSPAGGTEP